MYKVKFIFGVKRVFFDGQRWHAANGGLVRGVAHDMQVGHSALTDGRGDKEDRHERGQTAIARQGGKGSKMACLSRGWRVIRRFKKGFKAGEGLGRPIAPRMTVG